MSLETVPSHSSGSISQIRCHCFRNWTASGESQNLTVFTTSPESLSNQNRSSGAGDSAEPGGILLPQLLPWAGEVASFVGLEAETALTRPSADRRVAARFMAARSYSESPRDTRLSRGPVPAAMLDARAEETSRAKAASFHAVCAPFVH
eukprot:COSAG02_NODE_2494_length_8688_cov_2.385144_3_plen_149_part_00